MSGLPMRRLARLVAGVAGPTLVVGLAGCAAEPEPEPVVWPGDPPAQEAPELLPAEVDPAETEATEAILTVLDGFRRVEMETYTDPRPPHVARQRLSAYLADPLLSRTVGTLDTMLRAGVVFEGRPASEPVVAELRLNATPPTATIHDCLDTADWRPVFRETGDPVPADDVPDRYLMRLDAKLFPDGWLLHDAAIEEETPC